MNPDQMIPGKLYLATVENYRSLGKTKKDVLVCVRNDATGYDFIGGSATTTYGLSDIRPVALIDFDAWTVDPEGDVEISDEIFEQWRNAGAVPEE